MSLAGAVSLIASAIHDIQAIRYSHIASGTIILYDHLVTLDDEVELIWKSSWSWGKGLFILNRYYAMISVIVNTYGLFSSRLTNAYSMEDCLRANLLRGFLTSCFRFFHWQGWTGLIACMIAEVILQMRLYAMYSLNKKVLAVMGGCFIVATAASAFVLGSVLSKITATAFPLTPNLIFCVPSNISHQFFVFWIPMLAFETLMCGLALYKGYETFRTSGSRFRTGRYLVGILIRDSVLYFLVMFATYLTNLLVWITASQNLLEIPIGFSVALSCVMGNHIVLNVRQVNRELELARISEKPVSRSNGRSRSIVLVPGLIWSLRFDSHNTIGAPEASQSDDNRKSYLSVVIPMSIGVVLAAMDGTIVVSSYAAIGSELHSLQNTSWIATAYMLTMTSFQPLYGKLSDIFGRKGCLLFAYTIFALGCLGCGLARNMTELIASRAFAGIGGGGMST
ncbi:hypothetical protein LshimejAT787_0600760 [Lyophyllum shimeji]|uniref:Major facilitator superfamily (MFS) profile domain-containing protein n=1 Tax=Lyophyllum shimeji TaxID=47721 RepID=A0A9P3PNY2_LYOSH|nr:hypothetical protein LshimejAT787_0600760 [Lyophyllum shimeji]